MSGPTNSFCKLIPIPASTIAKSIHKPGNINTLVNPFTEKEGVF